MVKPKIPRVSRRAIDRPRDPAGDPVGFGIGMIMAPGSLGSSFYANPGIVRVVTYAADAGSAERTGPDGFRMASSWMVHSAWHGWHPAATPSQGLDALDDSARARGEEQTGTSALVEELESEWQRADASIRASAIELVKALGKGPATPHAVRKQANNLIVNLEHIVEAVAKKQLAEQLLASAKEAASLSEVAAPAHAPGYEAAVKAGADVRARIMAAPEMVKSIELARLPTPLYTADEITLAHLALLAQATHHLEAIARAVAQAPRERLPLDVMKLAELLHAVKGQLDRLRPLHLARKAALRTRGLDGEKLS